ncbi:hypothetical protein D3C80_1871750 [compost metagenome]
MALVSKHGIVLLRHPEIPKSRSKTVDAGHLGAGNVLKTTIRFRITAQAIAPVVDLIGYLSQVGGERLPQTDDAFVLIEGKAIPQARDDKLCSSFKARFRECYELPFFHT